MCTEVENMTNNQEITEVYLDATITKYVYEVCLVIV